MTRTLLSARQVLDLQQIEPFVFRSVHAQTNHGKALYGGQLLAQALLAASRVTPGKAPHSLHGYFIRSGSVTSPIDYHVERLREGRRLATLQVTALQEGKLIFHLHCSFATELSGFEHQIDPPSDLPQPLTRPSVLEYVAEHKATLPPTTVEIYGSPFPMEIRLLDPESSFVGRLPEPRRGFWVRVPSAADLDDDLMHQCMVAFLSDYWLAAVTAGQHITATDRARYQIVSLDQGVWFHRPARADQWLLYLTDSPSAQQGRGVARGLLYDQAGALVATSVQEAMFQFKDAVD